jgi:hypothetical protein
MEGSIVLDDDCPNATGNEQSLNSVFAMYVKTELSSFFIGSRVM